MKFMPFVLIVNSFSVVEQVKSFYSEHILFIADIDHIELPFVILIAAKSQV